MLASALLRDNSIAGLTSQLRVLSSGHTDTCLCMTCMLIDEHVDAQFFLTRWKSTMHGRLERHIPFTSQTQLLRISKACQKLIKTYCNRELCLYVHSYRQLGTCSPSILLEISNISPCFSFRLTPKISNTSLSSTSLTFCVTFCTISIARQTRRWSAWSRHIAPLDPGLTAFSMMMYGRVR
jgi:hypothetical protein